MAAKSDFTEEEWETLKKGVTGAGLLVAVSDRGFFDTFKEAGAMAKHLAAGQSSSSQLVRDLGETKSAGFGLRESPQELEQETVNAEMSAVQLLQQKAPDEVEPYRQFVLDVATSVADAAKGTSAGESQVIERIRAALNPS